MIAKIKARLDVATEEKEVDVNVNTESVLHNAISL
jgi:hypothetical protein